jgi:hypothetical protein
MVRENEEIKRVPYNPQYDIKLDPRKRNNDNGIFEVQKGKGITL